MPRREWSKLVEGLVADEGSPMGDELTEEDYDRRFKEVFQGTMILGEQGCSFYHALVLTGDHRGRVLNLNIDLGDPPIFAYEETFLDWYERWLNEVISGDLSHRHAGWFGYTRGGTGSELLHGFRRTGDVSYLKGLLSKACFTSESLDELESVVDVLDGEALSTAIGVLARFDPERAEPWLKRQLAADPLAVFQRVHWYGQSCTEAWAEDIKNLLSQDVENLELFRFLGYVAAKCRTDLSEVFEPYLRHTDSAFRQQAEYALRKISSGIRAIND